MYVFNEDEELLRSGRAATGSGLVGLLFGVLFSLYLGISAIGGVFLTLASGYLFLTGYWGGHRMNRWMLKYRYELPMVVWHPVRILAVLIGIVLGILGWGVFEHFLLLIAIMDEKGGLFLAQAALLPWLGPRYANRLRYGSRHHPPEETR